MDASTLKWKFENEREKTKTYVEKYKKSRDEALDFLVLVKAWKNNTINKKFYIANELARDTGYRKYNIHDLCLNSNSWNKENMYTINFAGEMCEIQSRVKSDVIAGLEKFILQLQEWIDKHEQKIAVINAMNYEEIAKDFNAVIEKHGLKSFNYELRECL